MCPQLRLRHALLVRLAYTLPTAGVYTEACGWPGGRALLVAAAWNLACLAAAWAVELTNRRHFLAGAAAALRRHLGAAGKAEGTTEGAPCCLAVSSAPTPCLAWDEQQQQQQECGAGAGAACPAGALAGPQTAQDRGGTLAAHACADGCGAGGAAGGLSSRGVSRLSQAALAAHNAAGWGC